MIANKSFSGRVLRVDLSTGTITKEQFDKDDLRKFLGGNGVGIKILYDEVPPEVAPFDAENELIFTAGPLTGTKIPGSGTYNVVTKGPMTDMLASAQAQGFFGARMKFAGFDIIILQGKAKEWQYLYIHDGEAELRPAAHLLGREVYQTEIDVKKEIGLDKISVACIGPAGENLIPFAGIFNDYGHVASTNGCGAVMGSKKLKAIAAGGDPSMLEVYDPEGLTKHARGAFLENAEKSMFGAIKTFGTLTTFQVQFMIGQVPIKNFTTNEWEDEESFYAENIYAKISRKKRPCWACPWAHCSKTTVHEGPMAGYEGEEPEFESLTAFTTNIGNKDIGTGIYLSNVTNNFGMDVKELGHTIALVFECFEKGLISQKDTGGMEFHWGQTQDVERLIREIATRQGFGAILSDGVKKAAERIGGEALNMGVWVGSGKGIAPHMVDFRAGWTYLLASTLSDNGSLYGAGGQDPEVGNMDQIGFFEADKVPAYNKNYSDRWVVNDAVGICMFFAHGSMQPLVDAINMATGWDLTREELLATGSRIRTLSRAYNIRNGLIPEVDNIPSPRLASSQTDGSLAAQTGKTPDVKEHYDEMQREYYRLSGWDEKTSKPLPETLKELGLDFVIQDMQ